MLLRSGGTAQGPGAQPATRMAALAGADPNGTPLGGSFPTANPAAPSPFTHPPNTKASSLGGGLATAPSSPRSPLDHKLKQLVDDAVVPLLARIAELEAKLQEQVCRTKQDVFFTTCEAAAFAFDLEPTEIGSWLVIHFLPAVKDRIPSGVVFYN